MTNKQTNNILYFLSVAVLSGAAYLLNYCVAIYQCAVVFTTMAIIANFITSRYSQFKAMTGLAFALILGFALTWNLSYYIDGIVINGLVVASLTSAMISIYWSSSVFLTLGANFINIKSNVVSLLVAALVDGFVMGVFYIINNNFSLARILDIFTKEVSYKVLYGVVASVLISIAVKSLQSNNISNNRI